MCEHEIVSRLEESLSEFWTAAALWHHRKLIRQRHSCDVGDKCIESLGSRNFELIVRTSLIKSRLFCCEIFSTSLEDSSFIKYCHTQFCRKKSLHFWRQFTKTRNLCISPLCLLSQVNFLMCNNVVMICSCSKRLKIIINTLWTPWSYVGCYSLWCDDKIYWSFFWDFLDFSDFFCPSLISTCFKVFSWFFCGDSNIKFRLTPLFCERIGF